MYVLAPELGWIPMDCQLHKLTNCAPHPWQVDNVYPNKWRDPASGPWNIATTFTRARVGKSVQHTDLKSLTSMMTTFKAAFAKHLSDTDITNLKQLETLRNDLWHMRRRRLDKEPMQERVDACLAALKEGPWTKEPFAAATAAAVQAILEQRNLPVQLLPPLEDLEAHYVPQTRPIAWLKALSLIHI